MDWSRIVDVVKLPVKYVGWIALLSGLVLFLPESWIAALDLAEFSNKHGAAIGIAFLASSSLSAINGLLWVRSAVLRSRRVVRTQTRMLEDIANLDERERAVLREFAIQGQQTVKLPIDHPVVAGLLHRGILQVVGRICERSLAGTLMSVRIGERARNNLTTEMLDLPREGPSQAEVQELLGNRPGFVETLEHHERVFHRW